MALSRLCSCPPPPGAVGAPPGRWSRGQRVTSKNSAAMPPQGSSSVMILAATCCSYAVTSRAARTQMSARGRSGAARGDGGHDRSSLRPGPLEGGLAAVKNFTRKLVRLKNRRGELVDELELAKQKFALSQASAQEMLLALEEEVESERRAKELIGREFLQTQTSYGQLSDMFEFEQMEQMKLQARLQEANKAQQTAQAEVDTFGKKLAKLDQRCQTLQAQSEELRLQLQKADTVNDALKKQVAKQNALIDELLALQQTAHHENSLLRKENAQLKKQLEFAERSLALLLDPVDDEHAHS
mmetsp:Transcript_46895/g.109789  ORF Transcript_46895/g.109789 Transcript_46895/m.109789 type:complete len:299 (+) Transcript_46895:65-961(+)